MACPRKEGDVAEYSGSASVDASADRTFDYLSRPENLPEYVATMVLAKPVEEGRLQVAAEVQGRHEEGEASYRTDPGARRIEWGSEGEGGYAGWLEVHGDGDDCSVEIHIRSDRDEDADEIDRVISKTLANIRQLVERIP